MALTRTKIFTRWADAEADILSSNLPSTEKESLIRARRGQGIFRRKVAKNELGCRLSGVTVTAFLVASHIKPWAVSSNDERLDGSNGLLLSPHVDMLCDNGFITFNQDGTVVISPEAIEENYPD
jgi:putative restriction endonuclease